MGLDGIVNIELSVMQTSETEDVAHILKKAHTNYYDLPPEQYNQEELPKLVQELNQKDLVVVGKEGGLIVAAYDLPPFSAENGSVVLGKVKAQDRMGYTTYHGLPDYFAVKQQGRGIGKSFFYVFTNMLEQLALEVDKPVFHRPDVVHMAVQFFAKIGYEARLVSPGVKFDYHVVEKVCYPKQHVFTPSEMDVLKAMRTALQAHVQSVQK